MNKLVFARAESRKLILQAATEVFAHNGFAGTTTAAVAARAGLPKANLHYYFPTKTALYRAVIEPVLAAWLDTASSFDESKEPEVALTRYIAARMDLARAMPFESRIWASEIMRGAPSIQDFLENTLAEWVESRSRTVRR
jgi:TetR/AcrR family transcriptional regulator